MHSKRRRQNPEKLKIFSQHDASHATKSPSLPILLHDTWQGTCFMLMVLLVRESRKIFALSSTLQKR
jgi:hypothetical protein